MPEPVKPSIRKDQDVKTSLDHVANGDLRYGDIRRIIGWCGNKTVLAPHDMGPFRVMQPAAHSEEDGTVPNRAMFDDLIEVITVDLPSILVLVYRLDGSWGYALLEAKEFECRKPDPHYQREFFRIHYENRIRGLSWIKRKLLSRKGREWLNQPKRKRNRRWSGSTADSGSLSQQSRAALPGAP